MKRILSIVLSFCVLLSGFSGATLGTAIADTPDSSYFVDDSNWGVYGKGAAVDGSQKGNILNTWMTATTVDSYQGKKAVSVAVRDAIPALAIPVEANKYYKFTLSYFVPETAIYHSYLTDSYMGSIGIYASGSVFTGDPAKHTSGGELLGTPETKQGVAGEWAEIEIKFDSKENTTVYFAGYFVRNDSGANANMYYFADFALTETLPDVNYYEDGANWGVYAKGAAVDGSQKGNIYNTWMTATTVYGYEGKQVATSVAVRDAIPALAIPVEANKHYRFTLSYFVPDTATYHNNLPDSYMSSIGIYAFGSVFTGDPAKHTSGGALLGSPATKQGVAGAWTKIEIKFESKENTTVYFAGYFLRNDSGANANMYYFADFALTEVQDWETYLEGSAKLGTGGTLANSTVTNTTAADADQNSDGKAFRLEANNYCQYATYTLNGLGKNTYYNLTFYYKAAAATELDWTGGMFSHMYVLRDGGENLERSSTHLGAVTRNVAYYYNKNDAFITLSGSVNSGVSNTDWNMATVQFYSDDVTSALLALRLTVNAPVYIDNIQLSTTSAFENADYKHPDGWNSYTENSAKLGTGGTVNGGTVEEVTVGTWSPEYRYQLNPDNYCQWVTKKITGLTPDTYYKLTFQYRSPSSASDDSMFSSVRIVKDGGENSGYTTDVLGEMTPSASLYTNKHGLIVPLEDNGTDLYQPTKNEWTTIELYFYSANETSAILAMRPVATTTPSSSDAAKNAAPVYIKRDSSAFKLQAVSESNFRLTDQEPNTGWGGKKDEYKIDFDDEDFYVHFLQTENRLKIENSPARDGKATNALHILPGSFVSETCLNYASVTAKPGKDPVFTMQVEPNQKYSISYWMYLEEGQDPLHYFTFYYDYANSKYTTHTNMSEFGKWVKFETFFTTEPGQTECSLFFNASRVPSDLWIDNIVLKKIGAGTVTSEPEKSYTESPYNMLSGDILNDIKAAKSGAYKFDILKNVSYVFGATAGSDEVSSSRVFLSFDGINPIGQNGTTAPSPIIEANGKMERYGINFDSGDNEYVYIVIQNDDGKLKIEDPYLFLAFYTTTVTHKGSATDPNVEFNTHTGDLGSFDSDGSQGVESKKLHINNSVYLNENFLGINAVHQLYGRMPDDLGRTYKDWMIESEKETMKKMRVKMIRSFYGSSLSWDNTTQKHDFDSVWMQAFYQSCLDMQEIGVEIGITPQWQITNLISGKRPLASQGVDITSMGYIAYDEAGKVDLNKTYSNFAEFVEDSVLAFKARGINNVKQMFCFTECNNTMTGFTERATTTLEKRDYEKLYPIFDGMISAVDKGLKDAGLRNQYQIIAPCDNWRADDGSETYSHLVRYTVENLLDKVDAIGSHNAYCRADDYSQDSFYNIPIDKLSSTMNEAQNAGKQYWIDEYNVLVNIDSAIAQKEMHKNPFRGTAFGSMVNSIMNMGGVNNVYIWTLYSQQWPNNTSNSNEFISGVHLCGSLPDLNESTTPMPSWYAQSLITRYVGQGKTFEGTNDTSTYCSAIERDDGELTVLVTNYNNSDTPVDLTFEESIGGKTLYRYVYDPNTIKAAPGNAMIAADAKEANVTTGFSDVLPAKSVAIYTTEKPDFTTGLQTSYNSVAAIRAGENTDGTVKKNGLRTYNRITTDYIQGNEIVEYGAIVIRQGYLESKFGENTDPEFETKTTDGTNRTLKDLIASRGGVGLGVAYRAKNANTITSSIEGHEGAKEILWQSSPDAKVFTTYITGIPSANYGKEYLVRSYAIDASGNVYYGETSSISIFKVAKAIDDAYNGEGSLGETEARDIAAFKAFVGVNTQNYAKWCGEAGVGKLYAKAVLNVDVENDVSNEK